MGRTHTDVLISGGGMVGLTLGVALAKAGLEVTVVESQQGDALVAPAFDGRASALAYANVRMFRTLNIWEALSTFAQPINDILVSDAKLGGRPSGFSMHFDHREIGAPLGAMAENRHIRGALWRAAAALPQLNLVTGVVVAALDRSKPQQAIARLSNGTEISALLAVAAEGRDSTLRDDAGVATIAWDYPQTAIVTTVEHEWPHGGVAYEHFLPAGPFAILPLPGNRSSLVWTETKETAPRFIALPPDEFAAELRLRFGAHLGHVAPIGPRWTYPLRFHLARTTIAERLAIVGDAAQGIHPIAGQGLNLGLKDVAALAQVVLDSARLGSDFGAVSVLQRYERWRRFDRVTLALGTDAINRLFSNDNLPLRTARDLGLGAVDAIAPLRRFFMRHAGGDLGELPRLLRGEAA